MGTAKTDASGQFKFSYATRNAWWSQFQSQAGKTYIVAVDPPSGSGLGRTVVINVTVSQGTNTSIGTVGLP
jgi:hypothetical protein